jgi:hypothetical protein
MTLLDTKLNQEIKQNQIETRQMKTIITQLVKQKEELENKLKNKNNTKPKLSTLTLKKPNLLTFKPV